MKSSPHGLLRLETLFEYKMHAKQTSAQTESGRRQRLAVVLELVLAMLQNYESKLAECGANKPFRVSRKIAPGKIVFRLDEEQTNRLLSQKALL